MYGSYGVGLGGAAYPYPSHGHPPSYGSSTWSAPAAAPAPAPAPAPAAALPDVSASYAEAQAALSRRHLQLPDPSWWKKKVSISNAHKELVRGLTWSGDGAWLATCGDESIKLWAPSRSTDARSARVLTGHAQRVNLVAWDPSNPRVLASAGSDKTVRTWDVRAGEKAIAAVSVPTSVLNMAFHPQGTSLAVSDHDDRVSLLDPRAARTLALVRDRKASKEEEVNAITWTPDGRQFLLAKNKGAIEVLAPSVVAEHPAPEGDLLPWPRTHLVRGHTSNLFALACDPTNRFAVSGGADSVLALWNTSDWTSAGSYDGLTEMVRAVSFSYDGELIASLGEAGLITLVASQTMGAVAHVPFPGAQGSLSWHPSRYTLAYASGKAPALVNFAGQI